ncbi:MAG TPA: hypothetical protein PLD49_08925, partial [Thermoclostridium caenicola]|uniref:hypothetical protein n=1 Tax=Thermoclostridium caenicola TaxID=659425 RepID=UPI002CF0A3A8
LSHFFFIMFGQLILQLTFRPAGRFNGKYSCLDDKPFRILLYAALPRVIPSSCEGTAGYGAAITI